MTQSTSEWSERSSRKEQIVHSLSTWWSSAHTHLFGIDSRAHKTKADDVHSLWSDCAASRWFMPVCEKSTGLYYFYGKYDMSYKACKQSVPQWPLRAVASSHPMRTISIRTHACGTLAFSLSTTQTRARAQSVLLIVSPFNHHWQRKRAVAGAKWCDERRGEGAGRERGGERWGWWYSKISRLCESDRWPHAGCHLTLPQKSGHLSNPSILSSPILPLPSFSPVSFFSSCFISCRKISKLLSLLDFTLANGFGWKNETVQPAFSLIWRSKGEI